MTELAATTGGDNKPNVLVPTPREGNFLVETTDRTVAVKRRKTPIFAPIVQASRYTVIFQTAVLATAIAIFKMLLTRHTTFTGYAALSDFGLIYTGLFFITGILFGQVTTDLKEAEKMPGEMTANLEQIEDFFNLLTIFANKPEAYLKAQGLILRFALQWKESLQDGKYELVNDAISTLEEMHDLTFQLDPKGGGFVVNLVNCYDKTRRVLLRASSLARTSIIPSAHGLVQFFVLASTVILFFVKYTNEPTQLMVMICIYTVTWFAVRMVSSFDDPFEDEWFMGWTSVLGTGRLVHLFPVDEFALRMLKRTDKGLQAVTEMEVILSVEEANKRGDGEQQKVPTTSMGQEVQQFYRRGNYTAFGAAVLGDFDATSVVSNLTK